MLIDLSIDVYRFDGNIWFEICKSLLRIFCKYTSIPVIWNERVFWIIWPSPLTNTPIIKLSQVSPWLSQHWFMGSLLMCYSERFDESTNMEKGKYIPTSGFYESGRTHPWPWLHFNISPAEEKVNWFSFVLIYYAMKILCVFSPLERVSANTALRTEHKWWGRLLYFS